MSITEKTRKILWTKAGNQCAICKKQLIIELNGQSSIVGEECHIISPATNGPRHKEVANYDDLGNLILLCSVHHKLIDDNVEAFTDMILYEIKKNHESSIRKQNVTSSSDLIMLERATSTKDIVRCLYDAMQFATDFPTDRKDDYDLFQEFLGLVCDSDVINDFDEITRMKYFDHLFLELEKKGYVIVVGRLPNIGKYKLDTAFVYIITKEDFEKQNPPST